MDPNSHRKRWPANHRLDVRNIILISSIIGGTVLLLGVAMQLSSTVFKQNYADASAQLEKLDSDNSDANKKVEPILSSSSVLMLTDDELSAVKKAMGNVETANQKLGELRAVKLGRGVELYSELNTKVTGFTALFDGVLASLDSLRPAIKICSEGVNLNLDGYAAIFMACAEALDKVNNIVSADMQQYINVVIAKYKDLALVFTSLAKYYDTRGPQSAEFVNIGQKVNNLQDDVQAAQNKFTKKLAADAKATSPEKAIVALRDYLNRQQNL